MNQFLDIWTAFEVWGVGASFAPTNVSIPGTIAKDRILPISVFKNTHKSRPSEGLRREASKGRSKL